MQSPSTDRLGRYRASLRQANALDESIIQQFNHAAHFAIIEDDLNHLPRKLHNWQSAHNTYTALIRNHH